VKNRHLGTIAQLSWAVNKLLEYRLQDSAKFKILYGYTTIFTNFKNVEKFANFYEF